jgi:hypothetical protein
VKDEKYVPAIMLFLLLLAVSVYFLRGLFI